MKTRWSDRGATARGVLWVAAGAVPLLFAFWAEHARGMAPCALCLWERWPYRLLIGTGALWFALGRFGRAARGLWALVLLIVVTSVGLGILHFGVEQHWWPSPLPECLAPAFHAGGSFAERLASMPTRPAKPCDAANYLFSGVPLSFVALALLYAAFLLVLAVVTGAGRVGAMTPTRRRLYSRRPRPRP